MGLRDRPPGCPHVLVALLCHPPLQELLRTASGHVAAGKVVSLYALSLRPGLPHFILQGSAARPEWGVVGSILLGQC